VSKNSFFRLTKNAQMQGARGAFHLPVRQAILRAASRRIRSASLPRRRVGESARGVLESTLQQLALLDNIPVKLRVQQVPSYVALFSMRSPSSSNRARMRGTRQMGVFQQPVKFPP